MKKYLTYFILILISFLSVGLFLYKINVSPPCLNADEAANAYDAYSILNTGKDQYGVTLPLRFKSFGDYKLPLLTYMSIPFIKIFGLNEIGIRMVNFPFVLLFPIIIYLLTQELFNKKNVSLLAAFLSAFAPGLQLLGRQAHEGYMTAFFLTFSFYMFFKLLKKQTVLNFLLLTFNFLLCLFGYHSSRLWAGFFFLSFCYFIFKKQLKKISLIIFIAVLLLFGITDVLYSPTRIKNLLFFNNVGFSLKINEFRANGGSRIMYNKLTVGAKDLLFDYLTYFSPQFMVTVGDSNIRFGIPGLSPITPIEYIFIFIGLYYLFKNKEKWRYYLLLIFLFSPLSACLSWAGGSVTRSVFIFIPALIISAYGVINLFNKKNLIFYILLSILYFLFLFYSWDFYLNQYPKKAIVTRSWQCGYKELLTYVKDNYDRFNNFYVTRKNGQPYIYFLFYLKYSPALYQRTSLLSPPDEYGFGQIEQFDKFIFDFPSGKQLKNSAAIGFPDDFSEIEKPYLKEIKIGTEIIFLIKEVK